VFFDLPGWQNGIEHIVRGGARMVNQAEADATSQRQRLHYVLFQNVSTSSLPAILALPSVYWAERWAPPQTEGERAAQIIAGNVSPANALPGYYTWLSEVGVDGTGVTLAVADTGLDTGDILTLHPDFSGRVSFSSLCSTHQDTDGHGTNVSSIAMGDPRTSSGGTGLLDGGGFHWGSGSAPGALLYSQRALAAGCVFNSDAVTLAADAAGAGSALIGSHSFTDGLGDGASYNSQAQAWDALVRDADPASPGNQPYAVLFSAGNSGTSGLTSPKAAKNIVTVGATENDRPGECPGTAGCGGSADDIDHVADFSSRGPTSDGRIKPDVAAPGHVIAGAQSSVASFGCSCDGGAGNGCCDSQGVDGAFAYTRFGGTSQAVPRVAGGSALLFEWYKARTGLFPSPALNKALLINSAVDLKQMDVPNNTEGWGRVALREVMQAPAGISFVDGTTTLGATGDAAAFTATYHVQDTGQPVKLTLVWTDAPGSINCDPCLVNDLDLLVTQGALTWRGNNLLEGFSTTSTQVDSLNNVEGVHLPPGGVDCSPFEVKVRAQGLNGDGVPGNADGTDQDFALVLRNAATTPGPVRMVGTVASVSGGCDADGFLDRDETVDLTLDIQNLGCTDATGLAVSVAVASAPAGAVVGVAPALLQPIPDVPAGGTGQATWQLTLDDAVLGFCGEIVELAVEVSDATGTWKSTVAVVLDAEGLTASSKLDTADTDESFSADAEWSLQECRSTSAPTAWHMGQADCTGMARDSSQHDLIFRYPLTPGDRLLSLGFQHAFQGYTNGVLFDSISVEFDHDDDGLFDVLQAWVEGEAPASMALAGPYDLSAFQDDRADTVAVRFRFHSAANWVGPDRATGWDVDDISLMVEEVQCDPQTCVVCPPAPPPVPDGSGGTQPLQVEHAGFDLQLSWDVVPGAAAYNIYAGALGTFYSHESFADPFLLGGESCSETTNSVLLSMPAGDVYFLVAADSGCRESTYGQDSVNSPRPFASAPCNPH
jgi:hypothetical protein